MGRTVSYPAAKLATTRAALLGLALVVLLAALTALAAGPSPAGAATLKPCEKTDSTAPTVDLDGELTLAPVRATRKAWRRSGVRQRVIRPANSATGRPTFPVRKVRYGAKARVDLKGGLRIAHRRRAVKLRRLRAVSVPGKPALLRAKVGRRTINLFRVKGGKRSFDRGEGELSRTGRARLTAAGARLLNRKLRTGRKRLRAGTVWGYFNLYALYKVSEAEDPSTEAPEVPPVKVRPSGARPIQNAIEIKWRVRESFIQYVSSGLGTYVAGGATADPKLVLPDSFNPGKMAPPLVYDFNFHFASGWTVPQAASSAENSLVEGSGTVGFRYCDHGINFTVSDPEIELGDDTNSRLIVEVTGTDNSPLPTQRAVVTKLLPSQAESHTVTDNGDGTKTVRYEKIPGVVPLEGVDMFAGFYFPDDPFGAFSITYTYAEGAH